MVCRIAENVVEKLSIKQVFAGWSEVMNVVTVANLVYTTRTKRPPKVEYSKRNGSSR
jgi:hypothetical protein